MYDTDIDWAMYLEALERQAIRLGYATRAARRRSLRAWLAALLGERRLTRVGSAGKDAA